MAKTKTKKQKKKLKKQRKRERLQMIEALKDETMMHIARLSDLLTQVQLSDAETILVQVKSELEVWAKQQEHNACWYYPEVFRKIAELVGADVKLSEPELPLIQFELGCRRFINEKYKESADGAGEESPDTSAAH